MGEQVVNRFTYRDLWLIDYAAQIRSGELAPLAPFLVEFVAKPTEAIVQTAKSLARSEPDEGRRGLLLSFVALLAARYFDKETIRRLFREEEKMLRTNTFIDEWLEEAEQKGRQEGRREQAYEYLLQTLHLRFGAVPEELVRRLKLLSLEQITALLRIVVNATSLEAVEQAVLRPEPVTQ